MLLASYNVLLKTEEALEKETSDLHLQNGLLAKRNAEISIELQQLQQTKPSVNDASYWNNKWTQNNIYYSAPTNKKAIEHVQYRKIPIITDIAFNFINENKLSISLLDNIPLTVLKWLQVKFDNREFKYVSDKGETWNTPEQTLQDKFGDCDDWGILEYYIIREIFMQLQCWDKVKHRLKCQALNVNYYSSIPSQAGGHFNLLWLHSDGEWYTIESTYYRERAIQYFGSLPQKLNTAYGTIWFTFNEQYMWTQNSLTVSSEDFKKLKKR